MAPGVTVTTPSGAPGADGGAIRIRGINSFGGSSTAPLVLIDGIEGSLDSVDPVLIESISILKDAASSSIYGSRAANGVILVTTKRSSTERFTVTYKGTVGWQSPTDLPETVNALEYRELTNAMNLQDGNAPTYDDESMALYRKNMGKDPDLYPNTDWRASRTATPFRSASAANACGCSPRWAMSIRTVSSRLPISSATRSATTPTSSSTTSCR
jgi:TonB-dependent SusC/RagA subfamily outer membrane receptor